MKTLREYCTSSEIEEAENLLNVPPYFLPVYGSVKNYRTQRFPTTKIRLFSYPSFKPTLWFLYSCDPSSIDHLIVWSKFDANINENDFLDCFKLFISQVSVSGDTLGIVPDFLTEMLANAMSEILHFKFKRYPTFLYYVSEEQQKTILKSDTSLPEGYTFNDENPAIDTAIIHRTWQFAGPSLDHTGEKLKRLPCVVVHYDGKPVAYEMSDFAGLFNHLYVDKNHRRKGLAKCVELYLCQKFIRDGAWPYKTVLLDNKLVIEWTKRTPYWTCFKKGNKPIIVNFMRFVR